MLYRMLSYVCRLCIVVAVFAPIVSIETLFDDTLAYLLRTALAVGACYLFIRLDFYFEEKTTKTQRNKLTTLPTTPPQSRAA